MAPSTMGLGMSGPSPPSYPPPSHRRRRRSILQSEPSRYDQEIGTQSGTDGPERHHRGAKMVLVMVLAAVVLVMIVLPLIDGRFG